MYLPVEPIAVAHVVHVAAGLAAAVAVVANAVSSRGAP